MDPEQSLFSLRIILFHFPGISTGKESTCNTGDLGSIPWLVRSPGEGKSYSLQYSGLENSMDCTVHGVAKSRTRLSDLKKEKRTETILFYVVHHLGGFHSSCWEHKLFLALCEPQGDFFSLPLVISSYTCTNQYSVDD